MCKIVVIDDIPTAKDAFSAIRQGYTITQKSQLPDTQQPDCEPVLYLVNAHLGSGQRSRFKGINDVWEKLRFSKDEQVRTIPVVLYSLMEKEFLQAHSIKKYGVDIFNLPAGRALCGYANIAQIFRSCMDALDYANRDKDQLGLQQTITTLINRRRDGNLAEIVRQETYYPRLHQAFEKFRTEFRHAIRGQLDLLTHSVVTKRQEAFEQLNKAFNQLRDDIGLPENGVPRRDEGDSKGTAGFFQQLFDNIRNQINDINCLINTEPLPPEDVIKVIRAQSTINQEMESLLDVAQLWFLSKRADAETCQSSEWLKDKLVLILEDDLAIAQHHKRHLSKENGGVFAPENIIMMIEGRTVSVMPFETLKASKERAFKSISSDDILSGTAADCEFERVKRRSRLARITTEEFEKFVEELNNRKSELSNAIDNYRENTKQFRDNLINRQIVDFSEITPQSVSEAIPLIESLYDGKVRADGRKLFQPTVALILIDVILHGELEAGIEILRKLKMERPAIKYVVVTGRNDLQIKAFSYGADGYITKGADFQGFEQELEENFLYQYKVAWIQDDKSARFDNNRIVAAERCRLGSEQPELYNMAQVVCAAKAYLRRRNILLKYYSKLQRQALFDNCVEQLYLEIERNRFDVVLLDSFGEEEEHFKKGICYFKALKQLPSPPAVIMLIPAGYGILKSTIFRDLRDYFAVDYDDIWVKPLSIERLKELVSRLKQKSLLKYDVRYTLLLPKKANDKKPVPFEDIEKYQREINERFGGQTIIHVSGAWINPETGRLAEDEHWMIQILTRYAPDNRKFLLELIEKYGKQSKQKAIFLQEERLNTYEVEPLHS